MKMNYETATDFELNMHLAVLRRLVISTERTEMFASTANQFNCNDGTVFISISDGGYGGFEPFNPCADWSDIMPIAVELGVTLIPDNCLSHFAYYNLELGPDGYSSDLCVYDNSPQRALVICCIKVLEARK